MTPWSKIILVLVLCLSIGFKFATFADRPKLGGVVEQQLQKFFVQNGYAVSMSGDDEDPFFLSAVAGGCSMRVYLVSPKGWHRYLIPRLKFPLEHTIFVFDGIRYVDQPVWLTWFSYLRWLIGFNLGMRPSIRPVLGINLSPSCKEASIPWYKIAKVDLAN